MGVDKGMFDGVIAALLIIGIFIGFVLFIVLPWLWSIAKPFIHSLTAQGAAMKPQKNYLMHVLNVEYERRAAALEESRKARREWYQAVLAVKNGK